MEKIKKNECAFQANTQTDGGLTKREYFASMAMQGYLASYGDLSYRPTIEAVAINSVKYADALLKALEE